MRTNQTTSLRSNNFLVKGVAVLAMACGLGSWVADARGAILAHWTFDAVSGADKNIYADTTGNRPAKIFDLAKVTPYEGTAPFGQAASFNGEAGAYLTCKPVPIHAVSFSIAVWVKLSKVAPSFVMTDWENGQKSAYVFGVDPVINRPTDKNYLIADMSGSIVPPGRNNRPGYRRPVLRYPMQNDVPVNEWHHLAWVWERSSPQAGTLHVYMDANEIGSMPQPADLKPNTTVNIADNKTDIRIGGREQQDVPFHGAMDELWVFNEALQAEQIKNLMAYNSLLPTTTLAKILKKEKDGSFVLASAEKPDEPKPEVKAEAKAEPKPEQKPVEATAAATPTPAATPTANENNVTANVTPATPTPTTPTPAADATPTPTQENRNTVVVAPDRTEPSRSASSSTSTPPDRDTRTEPSAPPVRSLPVTPRNMGKDVVIATVPQGYSPVRLTGIIACASISLFLAGFLVWALGERAKMAANR